MQRLFFLSVYFYMKMDGTPYVHNRRSLIITSSSARWPRQQRSRRADKSALVRPCPVYPAGEAATRLSPSFPLQEHAIEQTGAIQGATRGLSGPGASPERPRIAGVASVRPGLRPLASGRGRRIIDCSYNTLAFITPPNVACTPGLRKPPSF